MDPLRIIAEKDGFFTRAQARQAGYDDRDVARMVRQRAWLRIRRGAYVFADVWATSDDVSRHAIRSRAVIASLGDAVALSHVSGLVAHGIDVYGLGLGRVHVTRLDGAAGRVEGDVVHHEGFCVDADVVVVRGLQVIRPERCAIEAASRASQEVALCVLDAGLRAGAFNHEQLRSVHDQMRHWPFVRHLAAPVAMADGRSGSVGESRGRWLFHVLGVPAPELQHEVRRRDNSLIGITDWAWPTANAYGEFDGRVKYGRLLAPGQDPGEVVFAEKRREDDIREETGGSMLRLIWSDYEHPSLVRERVFRLLRRAG